MISICTEEWLVVGDYMDSYKYLLWLGLQELI